MIRRREFIAGLGAAAWPLAARAQQATMPVIGFLNATELDYRVTAFRQGLKEAGFVEDQNVLIVASSARATRLVQQRTQTIPIVFAAVGDPIVNGIVRNVSRPEVNTTGSTDTYAAIGGRWLQLLKEAAPRVQRVGLLYNAAVVPEDPTYGYFPAIDEAAAAQAVQAIRIGYRDAVDLVHAIDEFGAQRPMDARAEPMVHGQAACRGDGRQRRHRLRTCD